MIPEMKTSTASPPPPRIGKGEKFPSGWFGDLWNWIRSCRPIPDNVTIFGTPTVNGIVLSAKQGGGGIGGGAGSEYNGYFTVISSGTGYKVVFGADPEATNCGTLTVGTQIDISIPATLIPAGVTGVALYIYYDSDTSEYKYMFTGGGTPPAKKVTILLASIVNGTPVQQWTDGAININYMGYVV